MQRQIKITIKTTAEFPDGWYKEGKTEGDDIAGYDFEEKCCIYEKIIDILQKRRETCDGDTSNCAENQDDIDIEFL